MFIKFKGTVSVFSSDPLHAKMAMPEINGFLDLIKNVGKVIHCFFETRNVQVTFAEKPQKKINSLKKLNTGYLIHTTLIRVPL